MDDMILSTLVALALLQIKHWYIDFVDQSTEEVAGKAIYGNPSGIMHSAKHGFGTYVCLTLVTGVEFAAMNAIMGLIDFVVHYHVDWTKMNYGNRDITTPAFWNHLGLDQMAHQLTYICIVGAMVL